MDRVKINTYFEYQLELDLSGFVMQGQPEYCKYELYGVVIHRGSAHGGHYICFARDLVKETDWKNGLV
jgi:ubiquitin carboxyl-terminal hydrolase 40